MLSDFLEVAERGLQFLEESAHSTEGGSLELFAPVERVGVLKQSDVILGDAVHDVLGLVDVAQSQLIVITIVENVHEIGVEGMDVVQLGELLDDSVQFFIDRSLHELDLAHVELSDSCDLEASSNHSWRLSLGLTEGDVDQLISIGDLGDSFEVVAHQVTCTSSCVSDIINKGVFLRQTNNILY
jgi:hypothetical protein